MKRVTVYVDGFNLYYGLRRKKRIDAEWKQFYWIDFVRLFEQFLGSNEVLKKVVYFTASPLNSAKSSRQSALLNANKILNDDRFEVVRGKYFAKTIECPNCAYNISKPEEKRTDVNISVRMMGDCFSNDTDVLILVTADSDLVPPIHFIQRNFKDKRIRVYFPPTDFSNDLKDRMLSNNGKFVKLESNKVKFRNSIMPNKVSSIDNKITAEIPQKWI
jgi:uncharacterized LabA/DUF88 family protein